MNKRNLASKKLMFILQVGIKLKIKVGKEKKERGRVTSNLKSNINYFSVAWELQFEDLQRTGCLLITFKEIFISLCFLMQLCKQIL